MGKKIDLGMQHVNQAVALVVALTLKKEHEINTLLQLHPLDTDYLPLGIQLIVLDQSGRSLKTVQSRESDNWIQQEINGVYGEHFSVEITLADFSFIEHFVI